MPFPVCLQDWLTVQGSSSSITATQQQEDYVDVSTYQDLAVYVEIASISNATLALQTSPTLDNSFFTGFKSLGGGSVAQWGTAGVQAIQPLRFNDNGTPLLPARYLRWVVTGSGAWSVTFRIWLSLNQAPGSG